MDQERAPLQLVVDSEPISIRGTNIVENSNTADSKILVNTSPSQGLFLYAPVSALRTVGWMVYGVVGVPQPDSTSID